MEEGMKKADGRWRSNADGPVSGRTCVLLYFRTRQPVPFSSGLYVICTCAKRPRSLQLTPSPLILSVHLSDHMRRASALSQQSPSSPTKAPPSPRTTMDVHGSDDDDELIRAKILLMGQRRSVGPSDMISLRSAIHTHAGACNSVHLCRSGKTSIFRVLFEGLNPKQAFYTEPTTRLTKYKIEYVVMCPRR